MCGLLDTDWSAGHGLTQTGLVVSDLVCRVHVRLIIQTGRSVNTYQSEAAVSDTDRSAGAR
jgi:hypothetical protein